MNRPKVSSDGSHGCLESSTVPSNHFHRGKGSLVGIILLGKRTWLLASILFFPFRSIENVKHKKVNMAEALKRGVSADTAVLSADPRKFSINFLLGWPACCLSNEQSFSVQWADASTHSFSIPTPFHRVAKSTSSGKPLKNVRNQPLFNLAPNSIAGFNPPNLESLLCCHRSPPSSHPPLSLRCF